MSPFSMRAERSTVATTRDWSGPPGFSGSVRVTTASPREKTFAGKPDWSRISESVPLAPIGRLTTAPSPIIR